MPDLKKLIDTILDLINFPFVLLNKMFGMFFYLIYVSLLEILIVFEALFSMLIGTSNQNHDVDFLKSMLQTPEIKTLLTNGIYLGIFLFVIITIYALIKNMGKPNSENEFKKIVANFLKAFCFILILPLFFVLSIEISSKLLGMITDIISSTNGSTNDSIAFSVFQFSLKKSDNSTDFFLTIIKSLGDFSNADSLNISFFGGDFHYIFGIVGVAIILYAFLIMMLQLFRRIQKIVFLLFSSSFAASFYPLDSGKKFELWKEQLLVEFFSILGYIININVFMILAKTIPEQIFRFSMQLKHKDFLLLIPGFQTLFAGAIGIVMLIAFSFGIALGPQWFSSLIGSTASANERDSFAATNALTQGGLSIAKTAGLAAWGGASAFSKNTNNGNNENNNPLTNALSLDKKGRNMQSNNKTENLAKENNTGLGKIKKVAKGGAKIAGVIAAPITSPIKSVAKNGVKGTLKYLATGGPIKQGWKKIKSFNANKRQKSVDLKNQEIKNKRIENLTKARQARALKRMNENEQKNNSTKE